MRVTTLGLLVSLLSAGATLAQQSPQTGFWQGKLEIDQYNFMYGQGVDVRGNRSVVSRHVEVWKYEYDLYQNSAGVAREELTRVDKPPATAIEPAQDVRIIDYNRSYAVVFNKGAQQAIAGPLEPVPAKPIPERKILGFICEGKQYRWTTFQNATVELQSWSTHDSDLRIPLLQVEYFTDDTCLLLSLKVTTVTELDPVLELPPSLFEVPSGLRIVQVPSIQ